MVLRGIGKQEWKDAPLPKRFAHELGDYVLSALTNEDEPARLHHARAVAIYFYCVTKENRAVDPRVLAYMELARVRYYEGTKRSIAGALGLVLSTRGNPGHRRRTAAGRVMTDEEHAEMGQEVLERRPDRKRGADVDLAHEVALEFAGEHPDQPAEPAVSVRTVQKDVAVQKQMAAVEALLNDSKLSDEKKRERFKKLGVPMCRPEEEDETPE